MLAVTDYVLAFTDREIAQRLAETLQQVTTRRAYVSEGIIKEAVVYIVGIRLEDDESGYYWLRLTPILDKREIANFHVFSKPQPMG